MPLILILIESGIELIPKKLRTYPSIKRQINSKDYKSQLLDNALHHSEMKSARLEKSDKRGRPDIAHACLLNALGSPLNKAGHLKLFLHTVSNKIFEINPEIRIARNFNRFKGLMAKLLIDGQIGTPEASLITPIDKNISDLLKSFQNAEILALTSKGKQLKSNLDIFNEKSKTYVVLIGCFQKTSISDNITALAEKILSISTYSLDAWVAVDRIINYYEISQDIM